MESLALVAVIVLFTALIGGPTALLLTYVPDQPRGIKILRRVVVLALSLVGLLFGAQLVASSGVPFAPRIIGIIGVTTSIAALLYEFKILKRKNQNTNLVKSLENPESSANNETHELSVSYEYNEAHEQSGLYEPNGAHSSSGKIYVVIFSSKRQDANSDLYYEHNDKLDEKIRTMPGYIKHAGIRHPETRDGVTVVYFDSLDAIDAWRKDSEHMDAKKLAKSHFYENYNITIAEVIDSYGWQGNGN